MEYNQLQPLVCVNNTKDACLYFDRVVPLNIAQVTPWENNGDVEAFEVLKQILPDSLLDPSHKTGLGPMMLLYIDIYIDVFPGIIGDKKFQDRKLSSERAKRLAPLMFAAGNYLIDSMPEKANSIFGVGKLVDNGIEREDPAFILAGLNLIDTNAICWKKILELRKDQISMSKLRRLRTFIFENYNNKPVAFIKDDILNRIEQYETTAKKWGFETKEAIFRIVFSSGTAVSLTAAAIASAFLGVSPSISIPVGIGSTFLAGNVALQIASHRRQLHSFKQENPVTYLIDLKK